MHTSLASTRTRPQATLLAAAMCLLAGCSTTAQMADVRDLNDSSVQTADKRTGEVARSVGRVSKTGLVDDDEVARPYLAGAPVPLAPEVALPPALRQGVNTTLLFRDGRKDLLALAEGITRATGIPVRVKPDALLPMSNFLPRAGGAAAAGASAGGGGAGLESTTIDIKAEDAALNSVLDRVASRMALTWRYDGRAIELFRLESRTFGVKALPVKSATQAGLGRNATQGGAFDNSSNTKYSAAESDPFAALRASMEVRMTRAGLGPIISPETGTVVITDTPEALNSIQAYLDRENRLFSRRVDLVFEAVQVRVRDNGSAGFNWSAVYSRVHDAVTSTLSTASPSSLVASTAGTIGLGISGGRFDGSSVVIQALAEIGTVVSTTRVPVQTINRRPASYAVRTTFNYIDQATGAGATGSAVINTSLTSGPTITQKDETVGTILTIVPDIDDDGLVSMSVSYDNTVLTRLEPFTTGSGSSSVTVQQKEIAGAGVLQQIVTRVGVPTVIGGFERQDREATSRRLDKKSPLVLGGSDRASDERNITVLMVTAAAKDGV